MAITTNSSLSDPYGPASQADQIRRYIDREIHRHLYGAREVLGTFRIRKAGNGFVIECASREGEYAEEMVAEDAENIGKALTAYLVKQKLGA